MCVAVGNRRIYSIVASEEVNQLLSGSYAMTIADSQRVIDWSLQICHLRLVFAGS
jgi:hypothetical protein